MLPADRARIGSFADEIRIDPEDFTGDRTELCEILHDRLQDPGPSPVWTAIDRSITALRAARRPPRRARLHRRLRRPGPQSGQDDARRCPSAREDQRDHGLRDWLRRHDVAARRRGSMPRGPIGGGRYPVPYAQGSDRQRRVQKPHRGLRRSPRRAAAATSSWTRPKISRRRSCASPRSCTGSICRDRDRSARRHDSPARSEGQAARRGSARAQDLHRRSEEVACCFSLPSALTACLFRRTRR